ncbi:MAG: hypothetical protein EBV31_00410 [Verrucomicrobia bacterium]|nr:hypothetical protein [Verrucomicrobiota bacterium]
MVRGAGADGHRQLLYRRHFTTDPGGLLFDNSTGNATITGAFALGTASKELVITTNGSAAVVIPAAGTALAAGNTLTIGSGSSNTTISSGTGSLTKSGTGLLILYGNNLFTGNLTINQGAIQMAGATAALGVLSTVGNQTTIRQGGLLDVNGAGPLAALYSGGSTYPQISIGALSGTGVITNSSVTQSTISLGGTATDGTSKTTFGGTLQDGAGKLNVVINGTSARAQAIIGAQPYTGVTVINTGNLSVNILADGGTASAQTPSVSIDRLFSLAGNATIQSSGTYGNEAAAAGTGQNNAALVFSNTGDIAFLTSTAKTLTLGGTSIGDNIFRPRITNNTVDSTATAVTVSGGLWILNPAVANTYTGITSVTGGQLRAVDGVGIPTNSPITLNGGVWEVPAATLARTLGTAAGNIQLNNGASGFAAGTTSRLVVTLGGGDLTWGTAGATTFAPSSLVLGSSTALGEAEITNNIILGSAARTVTVNNNANTGTMVTAGILSGVLSGTGGGLTKGGGGVLILGNANTYTGDTTITNGNLIVTSVGNASGTTASSLGASGGKVIYNPGDADLNGLFYVGPGETSSRPWTLTSSVSQTSARTFRIDATGSGALVLAGSFANTLPRSATGQSFTLELRGANTDFNQMNMVLTNSTGTNTATLNVGKNDGGVWVLNPASANTFTGTITSSGGTLGLTTFGIGSASGIRLSNGGIFAYGAALSTATAVTIANNATGIFTGDKSLTFSSATIIEVGTSDNTIANTLSGGATLNFSGGFTNNKTSNQTLNFRGSGSTVITGAIPVGGAAQAVSIQIAPDASLTLAGAVDTYTGSTTMYQGRLILNKAMTTTSSTLDFRGGTIEASADQTISIPVTLGGDPATFTGSSSFTLTNAGGALITGTSTNSRTLVNTIASGKSLIITGALTFTNTGAVTLTVAGSGTTSIQGVMSNGTSAAGLTFAGTGTLQLTAANTATGALTVNRSSVTLSGANGSWKGTGTSYSVNAGGTLVLDNATNNNDRLLDAGAFNLMGGTLSLIGNATSEAAGAFKAYGSAAIAFSGTGSNTLTFASLDSTFYTDARSALSLVGLTGLGVTNKVKVTGVADGFAPRVAVGTDFATYVNADGFKAFSAYAAVTDINASAAGDVLKVTSAYSADDLTSSRYLGALAISDASALTVAGSTNATLSLSSGAILVGSGAQTISIPRILLSTTRLMQTTNASATVKVASTAGYVVGQAISGTGVSGYVAAIPDGTTLTLSANATATGYALVTAASPAVIQVASGASLSLGGSIVSNQGFIKAQAGSLTLSARQYHAGETTVAGGTLVLGAGDNTITPLASTLNVESGATVDLNGTVQYVGRLSSLGLAPGGGGTVTSTSAATLITNMSAGDRTFGGSITGAVTFARIGGYTLTLESAQTYTGATYLLGSATSLQDDATFANTSALVLSYATLNLNNNSGLQTSNNNRIADAAPVTMRGSTITYNGRSAVYASETMGALTLDLGANTITATANAGSGNFYSAILTFASLDRKNNASVNFTGTNLGQLSNAGGVIFTTPPSTVGGGYLGAWAIANSGDYAAYNASQGVGPAGQGGFAAYEADFGTGKVTQLTATAASTFTIPAGGATTGMLKLANAFTNDIAFAGATDVLNLELGGLLRSNDNNASTIGTSALRGVITSGISELVVYNAQNTLTINSVIQGATKLVKDGAGTLTLTAANTYSLGTVFNRGTVNLSPTNAGDIVVPAGGLVVNGGVQGGGATINVNAGGAIAATNALTINGRSTVTFAGATTNTLASVTINNLSEGNPTLAVGAGSRLLLTSATPVTAASVNASATSAISGGTLVLATGANTFAIDGVKLPGAATTYNALAPTLNISSNITGDSISLTKTGDGLLQLSGQNDFTSVTVSGGGLVLGTSGAYAQGGGGVSGPLGSGTVAMAAGTRLLVDNNDRQVGNVFTWAGTPTFDSTGGTNRTLTLNGRMAWIPAGTPTIAVNSPYLTVALLGEIPNIASITGFSVSGPGALVFNAKGYAGDFNATALGNPYSVSLLHDGDGTAAPQTLTLGGVVYDAGIVPMITVGRAGGTLPSPQAANKLIATASISNLGSGLSLTNNNGYGLKYTGSLTVATGAAFNVATASSSNLTQGLEFSGVVTAAGGFVKTGAGTLVLSNDANSIGAPISVDQGVLSVASVAALGGATVALNPQAGSAAFRATANIDASPVIRFDGTAGSRIIEVADGVTLKLNAAFDLNAAAGATASLSKNDPGTLVLNASNSGWSGAISINQGALLINNPALTSPAGTGTISVSPGYAIVGAALQLAGGVNLANALVLQGTNNLLQGGINFGGQLESVSGNNTYSGAISMPWDSTISSRSGSNLTISGLITATGTHRLQFNAEGNITLNAATTSLTGALWGMDKYGAGTLTISTPVTGPINSSGGFQIHRGTVVVNNATTIAFGSSAVTTVSGGALFRLDNSTTSTNNRLTGYALKLQGATFNFVTNGTTETAGALTADQGGSTINMTGAGNALLTFASFTGSAGGALNVTGTFGTANNYLKFTTAPTLTPATTGILARVTVSGNEFATYNSTNGIVAFTGYAAVTNVLSASPTQTFKATSATANSLTGNQTLNALTISTGPLVGNSPAVGGLAGLNPTTLTLTSGAILATGSGSGATASLGVPVVSFGATGTSEAIIHVASGQTLTVTSGFSTSGGLSKNLAGALNFDAPQFVSGTTYVNGGTLRLKSGQVNTLLYNNGVAVNFGGTLDLNGGAQFIGALTSVGSAANADAQGGSVINSAASQATFVVNGNGSFGGVVSGDVYFAKVGTNGQSFLYPQTYTGPTVLAGGSMTFADEGTLLSSSSLTIIGGQLNIQNTSTRDLGNRIADTMPISMRDGILYYTGRQQANSTETLGAVTLNGGYNAILPSSGGAASGSPGLSSATLTIASLTRADTTSTLRFNNYGQPGGSGQYGQGRLLVTSAPSLTNNLIGPWAFVDREFASYDATYGVGALNSAGFAGYAGGTLTSNPGADDNIRFTLAGTTVLNADTSIWTLAMRGQATATTVDLGGKKLTLRGGGLLLGQETDSITWTISNGTITAGAVDAASDLFIHHANFGGTNRLVDISAVIADNGTGAVRLIKNSGDAQASSMTLSGLNTYTGGTVLNMGTLVLGATGRLGTGGIVVNRATLTQTAGGVIPAQALTLNASSTVTLAGNNSLTGLTFGNAGGAAPTLTPTGILTLTGGITSTTSNPGTIATIGTGTLDLNGSSAYSINVGAALVNGIDVAPWQAGLIVNATVQNGGIAKTGNGLLQLAGQNTFAGGVTIAAGGLVIGASSTGSGLLEVPTSGPVGIGTLTMANNTSLLAAGAYTISNNVIFGDDGAGTGTHVFNGTNNLTLNGTTTLPSVWNVTIAAPQMTVTIGDATPSLSTDIINKSGLGILTVGNYAGTISAAGGLVFTGDGNALGTPANFSLGGNVVLTNDTAVTVNRSGSGPNARNKTLRKVDLTNPGSILSVTNLSGYGLEFTGAITLNGASHFAVSSATPSNLVPGLVLSGVVADAGGYDLTKSGAGTLLLTNPANTFGGATATIDVLAGVLAASSDAALGNTGNKVRLNVDGTTDIGFRATASFSSARTFILNQANNAFEVTSGNALTLSAPFTLSATTNTLTKNDNGTLVLTASNPTWAGTITVAGGTLRIGHATALGSSALTTSGAGSVAYELTGSVSVANALTLSVASGGNGIDGKGVLFSFSGSNTFSGLITQSSGVAATVGAASGATLTLSGGITTSNSTNFNAVAADAVINLASTITGGGPGTNVIGLGTLNITANQSGFTGAFNVYRGTVNLGGSGVTLGSSGAVAVYGNGVLNVSDAAGTPTSRLVNRALTIQGGTFAYVGNSANSAETNSSALTFARSGGIFSSTQTGSGTVSLTFASLSLSTDVSAGFTGTNLGTSTNKILFTTAPTLVPATTGILARATVNGSSFATYNGTTGVTAFSAYNATSTTNLNLAGATDTVDANAAMTTKGLTASKTVNAVRFSGATAQTVDGSAFTTLTLTSGGLLATGAATHALSAPVVALAAVQGVFHADTGSTLSISSALTGTAGLVKEGAGVVTLAAPANKSGLAGISANTISGNLTISRGTLRLGAANAYSPGQFLIMAGPASSLDLNGFNQQFSGLLTETVNPGTGGSITSSSGTGQLVINQDNNARSWSGTTSGAVNFVRSGQNTFTVSGANAHTGTTLINGNTTVLQSDGAFSGTSSLEVNYATLNLDNDAGIGGSADRIADSAAITFRGASMTYAGRRQAASTETLGAVSVAQGYSALTATTGGTGLNSVDLTLASLSRPAGSAATINISGTNLGTIGSNSRVTVGTLNGTAVSAASYSANGNGLTNNLIGPWAIVGNEFATYVPGLGVAALNQTGAAQYDQTNTFVGGTATKNIRLTSSTTIPTGGSTVNSVTMTGSNIALSFTNASDVLNLVSGGLIGPNNNQSIGAAVDSGRITVGGAAPAANTDLYLYNRSNTLTVNSRLVDNVNGSGSSLRVVLTASGGSINLVNTAASYTGGTVINGGTVNLLASATGVTVPLATTAANGLIVNNATVTMGSSTNTVAGQIAAGNIVTMNGVSTLNLFGDNTLAGLVLNNNGGGSGNLQVNTFSTATAAGTGANGVLTIGAAGITATSSNIASATLIAGRIDFGASSSTVDVAPIAANGVAISPLSSGLQLQGIVGSAGGLTKSGNGVLQFNAQAHYAGPTAVNAGSIRTGVTYGGSRYSALTLAANAYLNLNGSTTVWGSLAGAGKVMNSSTSAATLVIGLNGGSTEFSGQLTRFNDATVGAVALQKVGAGQLTMSSAQDYNTGTNGAITVNGGTLRYVDAGEAFNGTAASGGGTFNLNAGGVIALDNSGTSNVNSRLGLDVAGTLAIQGGRLTIGGSASPSTPTTETITTFNVTNGGGRIELTPNVANPLTLAIGTLNTANGHGGLVIGGITGAASANGVANLTITTPNLLGTQGAGANGTTTMSVRHDILADASAAGLGTGFLVKDSATNNYRALASGELNTVVTAWAATQNAGLSASQTILGQTTANTLTISGTGTLASGLNAATFGSYGPSGGLLTQTLSNASATLVLAGATGNINVGAYQSATVGTTPFLHVVAGGTLNMNAALAIGGTAGIAKLDGGTLNLNRRAYYTGTTTVDGGTLNLASGAANTIVVVPTATSATVSALSVNGLDAVINLSNQAQAFGTLNSINPLPGQGGTITNSGGSVVTFTTSTQAASGTFAGAITGNLALTKSGTNTLTLTGAQTYVGETVVRGGALELRDAATLASTAGLKLFYGTLNWNNFGHNPSGAPSPARLAATNAVSMRGGNLTVNGAGSTDTVITLNSVTSESGNNFLGVYPYVNEGSTVKVTGAQRLEPHGAHRLRMEREQQQRQQYSRRARPEHEQQRLHLEAERGRVLGEQPDQQPDRGMGGGRWFDLRHLQQRLRTGGDG